MNTLLSKSRLFVAAFLLFAAYSYAQSTSFRVVIDSLPDAAVQSTYFATASNNTNQTVISGVRRVVFSVYLKNTSGGDIELSGGQIHFNFNKNVLNGGTGTLNLVASSLTGTAPSTGMWLKNPSVVTTSTPGRLQTAANTLPGAGSGPVIPAGDSILWHRFKLVTSAVGGFAAQSFDLTVRTTVNSTSPQTKIGAYIASTNTQIESQTTFFDAPSSVLPVELAAFNAVGKGRDIRLDWKTATEVNSSRFEIERSVVKSDSPVREWVKITSVNAQGNSNSPVDYSFTDKKLNAGKYAYRLKMVDADGTYQYAKIEAQGTVEVPATFAMSQNYPNPFNPSTKIDYQLAQDAQVTLELYAVSGEKIATLINGQSLAAGYHTFELSAQSINRSLASGLYIYRLVATGANSEKFVSVKKMVLMK